VRVIGWDTETCLIRQACLAPPLVCVTWQERGDVARIVDRSRAERLIGDWLEAKDVLLVGQNVAYDAAVAMEAFPDLRPAFFAAYDADRVTDTQIRQQLLDIASGVYKGRPVGNGVFIKPKYDLETLADRLANMKLQKDAWRLSYGEFLSTPIEQWSARAVEVQAAARVTLAELEKAWACIKPSDVPKEVTARIEGLRSMIASDPSRCTEYPLDDARATLAVFEAQERHAAWLDDQFRQVRAALSMHLISAHGLRTDEPGVELLRAEVTAQLEDVTQELQLAGLVRSDGSRDTKAAKRQMIEVCRRERLEIPRTGGHGAPGKCKKLDGTQVPDGSDECEDHVCLDSDACERTEDETLMAYAELSTLKKTLSNDVEALSKGVCWPIHTRFGLAETGRCTSSKPNIMNWVRARKCRVCGGKGKVTGRDEAALGAARQDAALVP
jgi:DNA polymerase-1